MSFSVRSGSSDITEVDFSKPEKVVLLVGATGEGKSTLGNWLLGRHVFEPGHFAASKTKKNHEESMIYKGERIRIVDTPGFEDVNEGNNLIAQEFAKFVDLQREIAGIIVVKNSINSRLTPTKQAVYNMICSTVKHRISSNMCVVLTKWGMSEKEVQSRNAKGITFSTFVADQKMEMKKEGSLNNLYKTDYWFKSDAEFMKTDPNEVREAEKDREKILEWIIGRDSFLTETGIEFVDDMKNRIIEIQNNLKSIPLAAIGMHISIADEITRKLNLSNHPLKRVFFKNKPSFKQHMIALKTSNFTRPFLISFYAPDSLQASEARTTTGLETKVWEILNSTFTRREMTDFNAIGKAFREKNLLFVYWELETLSLDGKIEYVCVIYYHEEYFAGQLISKMLGNDMNSQLNEHRKLKLLIKSPGVLGTNAHIVKRP